LWVHSYLTTHIVFLFFLCGLLFSTTQVKQPIWASLPPLHLREMIFLSALRCILSYMDSMFLWFSLSLILWLVCM
jgi:hypothetical protein